MNKNFETQTAEYSMSTKQCSSIMSWNAKGRPRA